MRLGLIFIGLIIFIRIIAELNSNIALGKIVPNFIDLSENKNWYSTVNVDDLELCELGYLSLRHKKFVTNVSFDRPMFRRDTLWITSFRNQFYVLYFSQIILKYNWLKSKTMDQFQKNKVEIIVIHSKLMFFLKYLFLFLGSICVFKILSKFYQIKLTLFGTGMFLLYPSTFYIFGFNTFDSLCYPLVMIGLVLIFFPSHFFQSVLTSRVLVVLFSLVISLIKLHVGIILLLTTLIVALLIRKEFDLNSYVSKYLSIISICSVFFVLGGVNFYNSGKFVISSQSGINFFHGHNLVAKGSWNGNVWNENKQVLLPLLQNNMKSLSSDELTEMKAYRDMAIDWILNHPLDEFKLSIKKIAIFFYPHNFLNWNFNLFTAIAHFSLFFMFYSLLKKRQLLNHSFFFIFPSIVVDILLNVYFFVEYRWRFYTDSLFIFSTIYMFSEILDSKLISIINKRFKN
jgi:phage pi2 protein 07